MNNSAMNKLRERQVQAYAHGISNGHNSSRLWGTPDAPEISAKVDASPPIHLFRNTGNEAADVAAAHDLGFVEGLQAENPSSLPADAEEALGEFHRRFPVDR